SPGMTTACAFDGGRRTRFLKSVPAARKALVSLCDSTESKPPTNWCVVLVLMLPPEGSLLPPNPPRFEFSLRVQRKKTSWFCEACQSVRTLIESSSNGALKVDKLGKYGVSMLIADCSSVFS